MRYIRRLVEQCVELRLISYEPGLGRGNKSSFRFLELDLAVVEPEGEQIGGRYKGRKEGGKEGLQVTAIRNEHKPEHEAGAKNHHACGALTTWIRVQEQLRSELPPDEWNLWVRPTYLFRVQDHSHLLLVMPPNNAIMQAALRRKSLLRTKLAEYGFSFGFAPYPDDYQRSRLESLGWKLPPKRKPPVEAAI